MYNINGMKRFEKYRKSFRFIFTIFFVIMFTVVSFMFFSPVINAF